MATLVLLWTWYKQINISNFVSFISNIPKQQQQQQHEQGVYKVWKIKITSVYEFSDSSHRTMWVYQRLRCSTNKKVVDTVVDNLEQQVVMVLAHTAIAD